MRFQQYILNEKKKKKKKRTHRVKLKSKKQRINPLVRIKKAEKIVSKGLIKLSKELDKVGWDISYYELLKIMNTIWKSDRISFDRDDGIIYVPELKGHKYIGQGETMGSGDITIYVTERIIKYLSKEQNRENLDNIKNEFAKEFIKILGHELIHRSQFASYKDVMIKNIDANANIENEYDRYVDYLKGSHEMISYAEDAAFEIFHGDEPSMYYLYQAFFEDEPEVFKSFVKILKKSYKKISGGDELVIE